MHYYDFLYIIYKLLAICEDASVVQNPSMSSIVFLASNHLEMERLRNQVVRHTSSPHMIQFTFDLLHNVVCELQYNGQKDKLESLLCH